MATLTIVNKFGLKGYDSSTKINLANGGDTIKLFLCTDSVAPAATHEFINSAAFVEVSGTNYTAGGSTLANQTYTESAGTSTFDADDVTFAESGTGFSTARYMILYKDTGTPSTSPIICFSDLGGNKGNTGGDLVFSWNASGILTVAAS